MTQLRTVDVFSVSTMQLVYSVTPSGMCVFVYACVCVHMCACACVCVNVFVFVWRVCMCDGRMFCGSEILTLIVSLCRV